MLAPEDAAHVWAQVENLRAEIEDPKLRLSDFEVKVLGGAWTMAHRGVAADAIQGLARSQEAVHFCKQSKIPQSARYEISLYGEDVAAVFARTWVAKMQAFLNLWRDTKRRPTAAFTVLEYESWAEPSDFTLQARTLGACPKGSKRVEQLRALFRPRA